MAKMNGKKLKTAILGLEGQGRLLLEAAANADFLKIEAVADKNSTLAQKTAAELNCTAYDDYRSLIIQNHFDWLIVAAPRHRCDKYVKDAIERKFNILVVPPLAGNFEEAADLVRLAEEQDIKFAVANPHRFTKGTLALQSFVTEKRIDHVFFLTAACTIGNAPLPPWRSDPKLAGGGVLMHECYDIIDLIISCFGVPELVYSLNTSNAPDRKQRLYRTEDAALLAMKFSDAFVANIVAVRAGVTEAQTKLVKICGKNKNLTLSGRDFIVTDESGKTIERLRYGGDELSAMTKLLENFALCITSPDNNVLRSCAAENLNNMAVIEAAYLSARTGFCEEPARILQMAKVEPKITLAGPTTMKNPHLTYRPTPDNISI